MKKCMAIDKRLENSRLYKTIRNIFWRAIVLLMTAVANLIIPRYIILIYGSEVNGLTSSIAHVLSIVNLIQAGLGSSVTYLLYQPIGENNRVAIGNIILSARRIYKYISLGVSVIGIVASVVFALTVQTELQRNYILIACLITCLDSAASTYFTAAGNVFLGAKQDGYLVSRVAIITNMISYALKFLVILFKPHFMFLYLINIVLCLINIIALSRCFKKQYQPFEPTAEEKKQLTIVKIPGVSYAAMNEIAHSLVNGSITIVISVFAGLKASSVFSVYMIAVSLLSTLSNAVYSAVVPSYGSVAAENDIQKTNRIFEIYQFVLYTFNAWMYMCAAYLMIPFVSVYTKGVSDADYYNFALMVLVVLYGIFSMTRIPYNNTVYIKGLFKETYLQPVICSGIALLLMVGLTMVDFTFTIIGSIFFFACNTFYQHIRLPKLFEGFDNRHFWRHLAVLLGGVGIAIVAYMLIPLHPDNFVQWFLGACAAGIIAIIILVILVITLDSKSMLLTIRFFKQKVKK